MSNFKNTIFINFLPLKTKRLIIRKTTINDVDMLLKMDKQEITQKYLGGIKNKTKKERIDFLKRKISKFDNGYAGQLTVCLKDETPIGLTGLNIDESNNTAEIGYIFDYDYCNKGYCTESTKKLINIAFKKLNIKSIVAETVEENNSSKRVLEKLGFKYHNQVVKNSTVFLNYIIYNDKEKK